MDFLDFVEEYSDNSELNQFEKVKVIVSRAKELYDGKPPIAQMEGRKATAIAQFELSHGIIEADIYPITNADDDQFDDDIDEEEEE